MHLPLESPPAADIRPDRPPGRILLVDDEIMLRNLHSISLRRAGYHVDTAIDGADAWKCISDNPYDLLITDNKMPKVTGLELIKKLRDHGLALPAILMSGCLPTDELARHPKLQLEAILAKPFTITELLDVVKRVLQPAQDASTKFPRVFDSVTKEDSFPYALKATPIPHQNKKGVRILVVDDDDDARKVHVNLLKLYGYDAEGVPDGAAGWEALQAETYNLVITDNKMPRMTGIEMIAKLRATRMTVPVIMATGNTPTFELAYRPWLMPEATLEKPFSKDALLQTVRRILEPENPY